MKWKKNILLIFFVLAGIILGSLLAAACDQVTWLRWMSFGKSVGISTASPLFLDFSVVKIAFGMEIGINVAQILCIILALYLYKSAVKKL